MKNNPSDSYLWTNGAGRFTWSWTSGTTGLVLGPIGAIIGMNEFTFTFTIYSTTGISNLYIAGNITSVSQAISNGMTFSFTRESCTCGNGVANDDPLIKHCEYTLPASTCCTNDCHLKPSSTLCNSSSDPCQSPSYCTGTSATCPPLALAQACNCTPPYFGYGCTQVRCDTEESCSACNTYDQCAWCCDSNSCVQNLTCSNPFPRNCLDCTGQCGNGTCTCGKCICPSGFAGATCNEIVDCTGEPVPQGQTPKKLDICGVCGGNGTSCIGCDGIPFGKQYDKCGICGGDGSSCYNPCPGTSCSQCVSTDTCSWCNSDKKCYPNTHSGCGATFTSNCALLLSTPAIVGTALGAAAIAGIVIGAAIFFALGALGAKKSYDVWMSKRGDLNAATRNPLYNDSGMSGVNPLHEGLEMKKV